MTRFTSSVVNDIVTNAERVCGFCGAEPVDGRDSRPTSVAALSWSCRENSDPNLVAFNKLFSDATDGTMSITFLLLCCCKFRTVFENEVRSVGEYCAKNTIVIEVKLSLKVERKTECGVFDREIQRGTNGATTNSPKSEVQFSQMGKTAPTNQSDSLEPLYFTSVEMPDIWSL
mmetsp:Transcript_2086/g.7537  ORF Transcript_2086/g.7537 Transcript_2086/m.7537 type:complete len:173 (+) Transcript_2086:1808-2326(+)